MKSIRQIACLSALLLAAGIPVAHAGIHSINVSLNTLPTSYDSEVETSGGYVTEYSGDYDSARRVSIMYQYLANDTKTAAFVIGAGVDFINNDYDGGSESQVGVRAEPGVAFNFSNNFRLETVGSIAVGTSDYDSNEGDAGGWAEFGVLVRPVYVFDSGIKLQGQLGLLARATVYEYDDDTTETITSKGLSAGINLGFQFR